MDMDTRKMLAWRILNTRDRSFCPLGRFALQIGCGATGGALDEATNGFARLRT